MNLPENVQPLGDRVLVQDVGPMDRSPSGLWMAPDWKEVPREGRVLAAGARVEPELRPGARIVYGRYAGRRVTLDGKEYIIMQEDSILGLLE